MTDLSSSIPTWPPIHALTRADGTGEVTINGTSYPVTAPTVDQARQTIIGQIVDTATKLGRAVHVSTSGPEGEFPILVHPDGHIEPDTSAAAPQPRRLSVAPPPPAPTPNVVDEDLVDHATDPTTPPTGVGDATPGPALHDAMTTAPTTAAPLPAGYDSPWVQGPAEPAPQAPPTAARTASKARRPADPPAVPRRSFLTQEQAEEPATHGWRGFLTRAGLRMAPSEAERAERADVRAVSQHWPGPRTIAVVNGKGGASKTPSTILLAAVFARFGGAGVLAWDNNQTRGTLGWRTEQGPHEATLLDVLPQTDHLLSTSAQSADLAHFVHHQTRDRYDVLRSQPMVLADQQRVGPNDVDAVWRVAAKYYRLILMDSGNDEADPMWLRMIDHTDQLVVVTTTRDDHAEAGALLLEALAQRDDRSAGLAANAVAVVSQADPRARPDQLRDIVQGYTSLAREVVAIPHDAAMVDGILRYGALGPTTQRAWLAAGAAVAKGL